LNLAAAYAILAREMKKAKEPELGETAWCGLVWELFPETRDFWLGSQGAFSACGAVGYAVDCAHRGLIDEAYAKRCYDFMRWSIRHTVEEVRGKIANSFFTEVLRSGSAKTACLDFLDWGDVKLFIDAWTVEPFFDDVENFDRLCGIWKKRWSRHGKLPQPPDPRTALWRNVPEDPQD
jgi:hypothetical protein